MLHLNTSDDHFLTMYEDEHNALRRIVVGGVICILFGGLLATTSRSGELSPKLIRNGRKAFEATIFTSRG